MPVNTNRPAWLTERAARLMHRAALDVAADSGLRLRRVLTESFGRDLADEIIALAVAQYRRRRP